MRIAILCTYPPRHCGHAEIARHLASNISASGGAHISVLAMVKEYSSQYGPEVIKQILHDRIEDYTAAANVINNADIDVVMIQHEFSIFGGVHGAYLIDLLTWIRKPVVVTVHNIPLQPDEYMGSLLKGIMSLSNRIVGITESMQGLLQSLYQVSPLEYVYIPLGVSHVPAQSQEELKAEYQLSGRTVATTFGLLHQNKGIEFVLQTIPDIVREHPDFMYLILGRPHPETKELGAAYYQMLKSRVNELGIHNHVRFVEHYLSEEEIMKYLKATDVYITPYRTRGQLASHTLTYAAYMGKPLLSTPYPHAVELTSTGGGYLVPFEDWVQLGARLKELIANPKLRATMGEAARAKTVSNNWPAVANQYLQVAYNLVGSGELNKNLTRPPAAEPSSETPAVISEPVNPDVSSGPVKKRRLKRKLRSNKVKKHSRLTAKRKRAKQLRLKKRSPNKVINAKKARKPIRAVKAKAAGKSKSAVSLKAKRIHFARRSSRAGKRSKARSA